MVFFDSLAAATLYCEIRTADPVTERCDAIQVDPALSTSVSKTDRAFECYEFKEEYSACISFGACPKTQVPSQDTCEQLCASLPECKVYTWSDTTQECYLKDSVTDIIDTPLISSDSFHRKDTTVCQSIYGRRKLSTEPAKPKNPSKDELRKAARLAHITFDKNRRKLSDQQETFWCYADGRQSDFYPFDPEPGAENEFFFDDFVVPDPYIGFKRCGSQPCTPGVDPASTCYDTGIGFGCERPTFECCQSQFELSAIADGDKSVQRSCKETFEHDGVAFETEKGYSTSITGGYFDCSYYNQFLSVTDYSTLPFNVLYSSAYDNRGQQHFSHMPSMSDVTVGSTQSALDSKRVCCQRMCQLFPVPSTNPSYVGTMVYPFHATCAALFSSPYYYDVESRKEFDALYSDHQDLKRCPSEASTPPPPPFSNANIDIVSNRLDTYEACESNPNDATGAPYRACCALQCQQNYEYQQPLCKMYYGACTPKIDYTGYQDCTAAFYIWTLDQTGLDLCCKTQCLLSSERYGAPITQWACTKQEASSYPECLHTGLAPSAPPRTPQETFPANTFVYSAQTDCYQYAPPSPPRVPYPPAPPPPSPEPSSPPPPFVFSCSADCDLLGVWQYVPSSQLTYQNVHSSDRCVTPVISDDAQGRALLTDAHQILTSSPCSGVSCLCNPTWSIGGTQRGGILERATSIRYRQRFAGAGVCFATLGFADAVGGYDPYYLAKDMNTVAVTVLHYTVESVSSGDVSNFKTASCFNDPASSDYCSNNWWHQQCVSPLLDDDDYHTSVVVERQRRAGSTEAFGLSTGAGLNALSGGTWTTSELEIFIPTWPAATANWKWDWAAGRRCHPFVVIPTQAISIEFEWDFLTTSWKPRADFLISQYVESNRFVTVLSVNACMQLCLDTMDGNGLVCTMARHVEAAGAVGAKCYLSRYRPVPLLDYDFICPLSDTDDMYWLVDITPPAPPSPPPSPPPPSPPPIPPTIPIPPVSPGLVAGQISTTVVLTDDPNNEEIFWDLTCDDGQVFSDYSSHPGYWPYTNDKIIVVAVGASCTVNLHDNYGDGWGGGTWSAPGFQINGLTISDPDQFGNDCDLNGPLLCALYTQTFTVAYPT